MFAAYTKVPVAQTRTEIERLLRQHKCSQFMTGTDYDQGVARVQFKAHDRYVRFVLTLPERKKFAYGATGATKYERAERQKWRALLLVIKAKFESVENHITTFEEEFLAQIVLPGDRTVAELLLPQIEGAYKSGKLPALLTEGEVVDAR